MDVQRAKEIATSPVMANVTLNGDPVYIQFVDDRSQTAQVYSLNRPENKNEVPLNSLIEH